MDPEFHRREDRAPAQDSAPAGARHVPVVQAKMQVGRTDDPLEGEADRVADLVTHALNASRDRPPFGGSSGGGRTRRTTTVRREPDTDHPPIGADGGAVADDVAQRVQRASRGGAPLDPSTMSRMGGAFGADFSGVRVHRGAEADALNRSFGAQAFTTGSNVFLGSDAPAVGTKEGDHLLAHELTHTIQQGGARLQRSSPPGGEVRRVTAGDGGRRSPVR